MYHSFVTVLAMFQCNTLCCNTKYSLCRPLAKGYVPPYTTARLRIGVSGGGGVPFPGPPLLVHSLASKYARFVVLGRDYCTGPPDHTIAAPPFKI